MSSDVLVPLLQYIGLPAVIATALTWLIKTILKESLSREADRLREDVHRDTQLALEQVRQRATTELESLRHGLTKELEAHKVRFAKLQDRRLDLLINLYSTMSAVVDRGLHVSVIMEYGTEESWDETIEELETLHSVATTAHRAAYLYLPPGLEKKVAKLLEHLNSSIWAYQFDRYADKSSDEAKASFLKSKTYNSAALLLEVAGGIRDLLGVEAEPEKGAA